MRKSVVGNLCGGQFMVAIRGVTGARSMLFRFLSFFYSIKNILRCGAKYVFIVVSQAGWLSSSAKVDTRNLGNWSNSMRNIFKNFASDMKGVTLIEYGLIAALIAVALVTVLTSLSGNLSATFTNVSNKL